MTSTHPVELLEKWEAPECLRCTRRGQDRALCLWCITLDAVLAARALPAALTQWKAGV